MPVALPGTQKHFPAPQAVVTETGTKKSGHVRPHCPEIRTGSGKSPLPGRQYHTQALSWRISLTAPLSAEVASAA